MYKTGFSRWALVALAAVALAGGVAWAAETQTASVPAGSSYAVMATIVPGEGGTVCGGTGPIEDDDVRFCVGFGAGGVSINGAFMGPCDPASPHTIHVRAYLLNGEWYCDTTVYAGGLPIASQTGHAMGGSADTVEATGDTVCALTVE